MARPNTGKLSQRKDGRWYRMIDGKTVYFGRGSEVEAYERFLKWDRDRKNPLADVGMVDGMLVLTPKWGVSIEEASSFPLPDVIQQVIDRIKDMPDDVNKTDILTTLVGIATRRLTPIPEETPMPTVSGPTLKDALKIWTKDKQNESSKAHILETTRVFSEFVQHTDNRPLMGLTVEVFKTYKAFLSKHSAPWGNKRCLAVKGVLNHILKTTPEKCPLNLPLWLRMLVLKTHHPDKSNKKAIPVEYLKPLYDVATTKEKAILSLMLSCALDLIEFSKVIRWSVLNMKDGIFTAERSKTDNSLRIIPLCQTARKHLSDYAQTQKIDPLMYAFLNRAGTPMKPADLRDMWQDLHDRAGVKKEYNLKHFRNTAPTLAKKHGHKDKVSALTGHVEAGCNHFYEDDDAEYLRPVADLLEKHYFSHLG